MPKSYCFKEIDIEQSPGFPRGKFPPVTDLSESLNIIWGPNGVGKTTLANSMRSVLRPTKGTEDYRVRALLQGPDSQWHLFLDGKNLQQRRLEDNQLTTLPGRPADGDDDIYWFSLADFLQVDSKHQPFYKVIYNEMRGGIDLEKAQKETDAIQNFSTANNQYTKEANQAKAHLRQCQDIQNTVNDLHKNIAELEAKAAKEPVLRIEHQRFTKAAKLCELKHTLSELQQKLDLYPPEIALVFSHSYKEQQGLQKALDEELSKLENLRIKISELNGNFQGCHITLEQLDDTSLLTQLQELLEQLHAVKTDHDQSLRELNEAKGQVNQWEKEHTWIVKTLPEETKLESAIDTLKTIALECEPLRCTLDAHQKIVAQLGDKESVEGDRTALESLKVRILDWMKAFIAYESTPKTKALDPKTRNVVLGVSGILAVILSFLSISISPWFSLLSFIGVIALFFLLSTMKANSELQKLKEALSQYQQQVETALETAGYPPVSIWNLETFIKLVQDIEIHAARIETIAKANERREQALSQLEKAKREMTDWHARWEQACRDLLLDAEHPRIEGAQFFNFSQHLMKWIELIKVAQGKSEVYANQKSLYEEALQALASFLKETTDDPIELKAKANSLCQRLEQANSLSKEIKRKHTELEEIVKAVENKQHALNQFWESIGLDDKNVYALQELSDRRPEWDTLKLTIGQREGDIEQLSKEDPEAALISDTTTLDEINQKTADINENINQIKDSYNKLTELKSDYKRYTEGSDLAQAEKEYRLALEKLEQFRQDQMLKRTVQVLIDNLEEEYREQASPEVLNKASSWFEKITANRYALRVNSEGFFAYDMVNKNALLLNQLSHGTRVQLLFAVRMGLIDMQERSGAIRFPIFMDELLANSDDARALFIINAIKEIAKERQVFYFTAQFDEVEKFRQHAPEVFHELPLSKLSEEHLGDSSPASHYKPIKPSYPEPVQDYGEYKRLLHVPRITLFDHIEQLHIWYLFDDSRHLCPYLEQNQLQVGQLRAEDPIVEKRINLLRQAQQLLRIGRCPPVFMEDIRKASILNENTEYWTQIESFLAEHTHNGTLLVKELEEGQSIKNIIKRTKQNLIDYLKTNGFASDEIASDAETVLSYMSQTTEGFSTESDDYAIIMRYVKYVLG